MRVTPECDTLNSIVICDADGVQLAPSVVFNGENYIVVWSDGRFLEDYYWVVTARVTPQGTVLDTGICIGNRGNQCEYFPDVAFDGNRCLAVWFDSFSPRAVYGRFINSSGQPEGNVILIATTTQFLGINPKIAFDGNNYLVVFADMPDRSFNVYGQLISPDGNLIDDIIPIATGSASQYYPDIIWDGHFYVVVWKEGSYDIKGQRVDCNGQLVNSSFQISNTTTNTRYMPAIAVSSTNYFVAWYEFRDSQFDIYGNVDQMLGMEEESSTPVKNGNFGATVFSGPLILPKGKKCRVFDITGRVVAPDKIRTGIYFIEIDGEITKKVVKVR